jgi:hypothetical protein
MKGVSSVENRILDNVAMSLPSAQQTVQTRSTYPYECICKTSRRIRNVLARKKEKENIFCFLFFRATNVTLPTTQRYICICR